MPTFKVNSFDQEDYNETVELIPSNQALRVAPALPSGLVCPDPGVTSTRPVAAASSSLYHSMVAQVAVKPINPWRVSWPVVLIMGAPKSGKKTVGDALASLMGFHHIVPSPTGDWADRFDHLEKELSEHRSANGGFIISSYGVDSDVDLHYLFHAISKHRMCHVLHVLYLDYTYAQMEARLQTMEGAYPPSSSVMAAYAMGYELCANHFASLDAGFTLVSVMEQDGSSRAVDSIVDDCIGRVRKSCGTVGSVPIPTPFYTAFENWVLVTDHKHFRSCLRLLDEALSTRTAAGVFPLRNPGNAIDKDFDFNQLQGYDVLLATNGQRALIFKIGSRVYALTERCTHILTYARSSLPDTFAKHTGKGENDLVFALEADLCTLEYQGNTASHVLLRDVLFYEHRTMERVPRAERREIIEKRFGECQSQYVLPHVAFPMSRISEVVEIMHNIPSIVVGFRFEHPAAGYKPSLSYTDIDTRLFTWSTWSGPLATLRLWKSSEATKKGPNGVHYGVFRFEVLVVDDDDGAEKPLAEHVLPLTAKAKGLPPKRNAILEIPDHIVHSEQLNDGLLVECRYNRTAPPTAVNGPAAWYAGGYWSFVRRRRDVEYPHYASAVNDAMKKPAMKLEELLTSCAEIVPDATAAT